MTKRKALGSGLEALLSAKPVNKNNNNNNPGRGGTGGSGKVKSCKDHDGAQGCELSRPTTICCGKNRGRGQFKKLCWPK